LYSGAAVGQEASPLRISISMLISLLSPAPGASLFVTTLLYVPEMEPSIRGSVKTNVSHQSGHDP
jgi:hypothetical protein